MNSFGQTTGFGKDESSFVELEDLILVPMVILSVERLSVESKKTGKTYSKAKAWYYRLDDPSKEKREFGCLEGPLYRQLVNVEIDEFPFTAWLNQIGYVGRDGEERTKIILAEVEASVLAQYERKPATVK